MLWLLLLMATHVVRAGNVTDNEVDSLNSNLEPRVGREKRFWILWCMNYPDCCSFAGADNCGFACPKCKKKGDFFNNCNKSSFPFLLHRT